MEISEIVQSKVDEIFEELKALSDFPANLTNQQGGKVKRIVEIINE